MNAKAPTFEPPQAPDAEGAPRRALAAAEPGVGARLKYAVQVFSETSDRYSENEGFRLGAAFSYYATFSIFPLLLLAVTLVGYVLGDSASARDRLLDAVSTPGSPVRDVLAQALTAMQNSQSGRGIAAVIGIVTLLFGASGAFVELDAAFNRIWSVPPRKAAGIWGTLRVLLVERLTGFAIVLGLGLTLLLSLVLSSALAFFADQARLTGTFQPIVRAAEIGMTLALLTAVFAAAFHFLPRSRPPARELLSGAFLTTVLLTALKEVFATYLSHLSDFTAYGVAGGVLALTTWIYLSGQIILLGAQFTRVLAEKDGVVDSRGILGPHHRPPR